MHRDFNTCGKAAVPRARKGRRVVSANRLKLPHGTRGVKRFRGGRRGRSIDRKGQKDVDLHLCPGKARPIGGLDPAARDDSHETDLPAEQPQAEEDPRLPGADAHQGRPPRLEETASEGAEADRGLTASGGSARRAAAPRRADGPGVGVPEGVSAGSSPRRAPFPDGGGGERTHVQPAGPGGVAQGRRRGGPESGQARSARELPPAQDAARFRPGPDSQARDSGVHATRGRA